MSETKRAKNASRKRRDRAGDSVLAPKRILSHRPLTRLSSATLMRSARFAVLPALLLALAGSACNSIDTRINQKAESFNALPSDERQQVEKGNVTAGFTPDMVYVALGKPDKIIPGPTERQ